MRKNSRGRALDSPADAAAIMPIIGGKLWHVQEKQEVPEMIVKSESQVLGNHLLGR